jgi:hypothetical protein
LIELGARDINIGLSPRTDYHDGGCEIGARPHCHDTLARAPASV